MIKSNWNSQTKWALLAACFAVMLAVVIAVTDSRPPAIDVAENPCLQKFGPVQTNAYTKAAWSKGYQRLAGCDSSSARLLFLGDSITQGWERYGAKEFKGAFGRYSPANYGIDCDTSASLVWRVNNGEMDQLQPAVIVVAIGTNDLGAQPGYVSEAVQYAASQVQAKWPRAQMLVVGILPRNHEGKEGEPTHLDYINTVNRLISEGQGHRYKFVDVGQAFLKDGRVNISLFRDGLHPNQRGYQVLAAALKPHIDRAMQ